MPGDGRRASSGGIGRRRRGVRGLLLACLLPLLLSLIPKAHGECLPVIAEFVLTGLSAPDGNRANHEVGICLPQFTVNLTSSCALSVRPKYAAGAAISLLTVGRGPDGRHVVPLASDRPAAVAEAVHGRAGHYYLEPRRCPQLYIGRVRGPKLQASDVAALLRRGLGVPAATLPVVAFTPEGLTIAWATRGPRAQELSYTAVFKRGGPTVPDFAPVTGVQGGAYCSLLDINPAFDLDSNPADGIVDASTATLVGRVPRAVPGRPGHYVCAIAPAGGFVRARRSAAAGGVELAGYGAALRHAYVAEQPNAYAVCGAGGYLYRLGAVNVAGDPLTDACTKCPRGSYATGGAALCAACPAGNYQDQPGQRACKPCRYGYAPYAGAARCMACYYGRAYCSEGFTPNPSAYTCNSARLPEGYSPEAGFSIVRAAARSSSSSSSGGGFESGSVGGGGGGSSSALPEAEAAAAEAYAPMFRRCNVPGGVNDGRGVRDGSPATLALHVSAECKVAAYVLGDLGRNGQPCSQEPAAHAVAAYYTSPATLAGIGATKGLQAPWRVGLLGALNAAGLAATFFAVGAGARVPDVIARPAELQLTLPESGWGYLGGGDNGQGQNAGVKGVNFDPCPPGTSKETLNGDGDDDPGEDPDRLLASYCVPCGAGTYCPSSANERDDGTGPQNCPAGTFGAAVGAKARETCVNCPPGTYQDADGASACAKCAPNTYAAAPGSTECAACGDGYEVSGQGASYCSACAPGTYRDSAASDACQDCPAGSASGEAAGSCSVCRPGTYAAAPRAAACTECPRGSYQKGYGARRCELCPVGTYGDGRGRAACKVCPVGTANPNCGSVSLAACARCPPGRAAPRPGSGQCSACGAGYYAERAGSATCRACPAGTYADAPGARSCVSCPKGTYADRPASRACKPCPLGFYSAGLGAARCMSCPAGAFTTKEGAASCARCPAGTYSRRSAAGGGATCAPCPAGTFSFAPGSAACAPCPAGSHAPEPGSTSCDACPLGAYSPGAGSQHCLPCRAGLTTAGLGAASAAECSVRVALNGGAR